MSQENSNSQATSNPPAATVPPSPGTSEEANARLSELERQNKGILNDLRQERERRQELEARLAAVPTPPSSVPQQDVNPGNELAAIVNPVVAPQINALRDEIKTMEAKAFLATKMGKPWAELESDQDFQNKLLATHKRYGVSGDPYTATVRTYELMKRDEELEAYRAKAAASAAAAAPATTSLPSGAPPAPSSAGQVEYDLATWGQIGSTEYSQKEHLGSFRKVGDKIVFTPH